MKVRFYDLDPLNKPWAEDVEDSVDNALYSGIYIGGQVVDHFSLRWSEYTGQDYCLPCGSGFDAIVLALQGLRRLTKNSERWRSVATQANTCMPTWKAVDAAGFSPIPIYPDFSAKNPFTINNLFLQEFGSDRPRSVRFATILVHLYGYISGENTILCDSITGENYTRYPRIIADGAQAHCPLYRKVSGAFRATTWSFYPTKNLGAFGDAGAVTTNDGELYAVMKELAYHDSPHGLTSRMDPIQAAVLISKLPWLDGENQRRDENAETYMELLADVEEIELPPENLFSYHQFVIRANDRDRLKQHLAAKGIETLIHYRVMPQVVWGFSAPPQLVDQRAQVLSLPIHPYMTKEELNYVADTIKGFYSRG